MRYSAMLLKPVQIVIVLLFFSLGQAQAAQPIGSWAWKTASAITISLFYATNITGADRMTFEFGNGENVNAARIGAQWDWNDDLLEVFGFNLGTYWQFDYTKWQSTLDSSQDGANNTLGLTPVFRFTQQFGSTKVYVDTSLGVYLFSSTQVNDSKFGANFQFSDSLAMGAYFGKKNQWTAGYKFQHYSNGSVKLPNNGINLNFLTVSYKYD